MSTKNLEAAQQRVVDAKADLAQLKSERIEVEGRAAKAEADKLSSKADPKAFKAACTRLSDAGFELERIGMLISEAESKLHEAEHEAAQASIAAEAERAEADVAAVDARAQAFCAALADAVVASGELESALGLLDKRARALSERARAAGVAHPDLTGRVHTPALLHRMLARSVRSTVDVMRGPDSPELRQLRASYGAALERALPTTN